jgi:hypothetical protein
MSLFRPTASKYLGTLGCAAAVIVGLLSIWSSSAAAAPKPPPGPASPVAVTAPAVTAPAPPDARLAPIGPASAKLDDALAVCPGQTFAQQFEAFGDTNYYTLVQGSQFNGGPEGWELMSGAKVVEGTRPDGTTGGVLDLPSGAVAVSPAVCVTLQYPTARAWVQAVAGGGGITTGVYYAGAKATGQVVGQLTGAKNGEWGLSESFEVKPELTGAQEGVREVRFVFANTTKGSDFHLSGLFVDPRMR